MEVANAPIADARPARAAHAPVERRAALSWLVLLIVITSALVATLSYVSLRSSREAYSQRALDAVQNLAGGMQQAVAADLDRVAITLDSFAMAFERATADGAAPDQALRELVAEHQRLAPARATLRVASADGELRFGDHPPGAPPVNIGDRPYFAQARDAFNDEVVVSEPLRSRVNGEWVIIVARRLTAPNGQFAGVAAVDLDTRHFERLFDAVHLGRQGAIALRSSTLALVARRSGDPSLPAAEIGSLNVSAELREALQRGPQVGSYIARVASDGIERANAYRRLERYPLIVIAGMATSDYLDAWRREVAVVGLLATLVVAALALSSMFIWRAWQRAADNARAAQREAHRHRALMLTASDGIHVLDREGRIVELNESFAAMLGHRREAMLGMHVSEWDVRSSREALTRLVRKVRVGDRFKVLTRHRKQDGQILDVEVAVVGVYIDGQELLYCSARDVTARSEAERELMASRALLDRTGRLARVGGWEVDLRSGSLTWSDETCRIHGVPVGHQPTLAQALEFTEPAHRPMIETAIDLALHEGKPWDLQLGLHTADGRQAWVRSVGAAEFEGRQAVRLVGAIQDITESEQRRTELAREQALRSEVERHAAELATLLQERSNMLDVMAHEVRQPLNNASAALQGAATAMAGLTDQVALQRVTRAQAVMGHVLASIDNTLAVASLLGRAGPIERSDTDIDTLVAVCVADMPAAERHRVVVERVTSTRTALMDMSLMRLALRNLLSNALKYSPAGAPVTVRLSDSDEPLALLIDVTDQGPGVPPELASRLFERGVRGHHPGGPAGLGLGLYIVRRVMELHRGRVLVVEPPPTSGLTIRLVIEQESGE
ncbi:PAS domain S-box protein [Aquincola tertiaricarbonis]|uniref:histidine kinase n=1 Tax=Aquincola tertiaricarbonis TaxID=391953 RepID=A0ABY4S3Q0_AQUTE|nr:PAS domain S-box protein [Aquincola tertiaricarbonis]URI08071.1 PAS domain S-box protein [Aquincola tertiaricarbonis]